MIPKRTIVTTGQERSEIKKKSTFHGNQKSPVLPLTE
jgi:hypothetical protein